jgi:hypothetical protein
MIDGTDALATAIYGRLTTALAAVNVAGNVTSVPVLDYVDAETPKPYVVIGDVDVGDWGTKTSLGTEQFPNLEIWSNYRGRKQLRQIAGLIYAALHEQTFAVDGQQLILCRLDSVDYARDGDGLTYVCRLRYRCLLDALSDAESDA